MSEELGMGYTKGQGPIRIRKVGRPPGKYVDMVDNCGNVSPVYIDAHDEMREDAHRETGKLVVSDYVTNNKEDPTIKMSVWDGINRVMLGRNRPKTVEVHVKPELIAEMQSRHAGQLAKQVVMAETGPRAQQLQETKRSQLLEETMVAFIKQAGADKKPDADEEPDKSKGQAKRNG